MPIYQWQCQNCGKIEEIRQSYQEPSDIEAPFCCGRFMERKISVVNNTFGWRLSDESHDPVLRETKQGGKDKIVRNV